MLPFSQCVLPIQIVPPRQYLCCGADLAIQDHAEDSEVHIYQAACQRALTWQSREQAEVRK
jgi:hypothetical protein